MFTVAILIFPLLLITAISNSMDRVDNIDGNNEIVFNGIEKEHYFHRVSKIKALGNTAFFPNQTIIDEAKELGFEYVVGMPFITVQLTNDIVRFSRNPYVERKLLHIPYVTLVGNNRIYHLSDTWSFIFDQETENKARTMIDRFYNSNPQAKMDLTNVNDLLVASLYEDNCIRREQYRSDDGQIKTRIAFGIDEN